MSVGHPLTSPRMLDNDTEDLLGPLPLSPPYSQSDRKRYRPFKIDFDRGRMSGYYYPPHTSPPDEDEFNFTPSYPLQGLPTTTMPYQTYPSQPTSAVLSQGQFYGQAPQYYPQPQQYPQQFGYQPSQAPAWMTPPTVPSNYPYSPQQMSAFPLYSEPANFSPPMTTAGPSRTSTGYLSPDEAGRSRASRATSFASNASSVSQSDASRSGSPNASEMAKWGVRNANGTWSCAYPGCSSRSTFNRGCDLRKHYKRHTKSLFCRHDGCPQATEGGFSSKKDRARHEAKHDPKIVCEWEGCERLFSRVDNMKDHVRRVHRKKLAS